ncbi:hypothetical protein RQP46_000495 [Phenoliferia psychrophenolica]
MPASLNAGVPSWTGMYPFATADTPIAVEPVESPFPASPTGAPSTTPATTKVKGAKAWKRISIAPPPVPDFKGLFARSMSMDGGLPRFRKPRTATAPKSANSAPSGARRPSRDAPASEFTFDKQASSGGLGIVLPSIPTFKARRRTKSTPVYGSDFDNSIEGRKRMPSMPNEATSTIFPEGVVAEPELIPTVALQCDGDLSALAQRTLHVSDVPRYTVRLVLLEKLEILLGAPLSMNECEEIFKLGKSSDAKTVSGARVRTSLMGMPPGAPARRASFFGNIKRALSYSASDPPVVESLPLPVVFGAPLASIAQYGFVHTKFGGQRYDIPGVCFSAVEELYRRGQGANIPGFFRTVGDSVRVSQLVAVYDAAPDYGDGLDLSVESIFDVSALLVKYLTDLPEPILDSRIWRLFRFACVDSSMPALHRIACAQVLLRLLPTPKLSLLIYLVAFLSIVPLFPENANSLELMASLYGVAIMAPRKISTSGDFEAGTTKSSGHYDLAAGVADAKARAGLLWLLRNWGAVAEGVLEKDLVLNMDEILAQTIPMGRLEPTTLNAGFSAATAVLSPLTFPPASPMLAPSPAFSLDITTRWGDISYSRTGTPLPPDNGYCHSNLALDSPTQPGESSQRESSLYDSTVTATSHRDSFFPLPTNLPSALRNLVEEPQVEGPADPTSPESNEHDTSPKHGLPRLSKGSPSTIGSVSSSREGSVALPVDPLADFASTPPGGEAASASPHVQTRDGGPGGAKRPFSTDLVRNVAEQQKIDLLLRELGASDPKESPVTGAFDETALLRQEVAALKQSRGRMAALEQRESPPSLNRLLSKDMTGNPAPSLVVKLSFGSSPLSRRITFSNAEAVYFEQFKEKIAQCFSLDLASFRIAYLDDDGDECEISTPEDLVEAVSYFDDEDRPSSSGASSAGSASAAKQHKITMKLRLIIEINPSPPSEVSWEGPPGQPYAPPRPFSAQLLPKTVGNGVDDTRSSSSGSSSKESGHGRAGRRHRMSSSSTGSVPTPETTPERELDPKLRGPQPTSVSIPHSAPPTYKSESSNGDNLQERWLRGEGERVRNGRYDPKGKGRVEHARVDSGQSSSRTTSDPEGAYSSDSEGEAFQFDAHLESNGAGPSTLQHLQDTEPGPSSQQPFSLPNFLADLSLSRMPAPSILSSVPDEMLRCCGCSQAMLDFRYICQACGPILPEQALSDDGTQIDGRDDDARSDVGTIVNGEEREDDERSEFSEASSNDALLTDPLGVLDAVAAAKVPPILKLIR